MWNARLDESQARIKISGRNVNNLRCTDSVKFSRSVVSNSLWPCGLQHSRLPCPSPTPRACSTHVHRGGDAIQPSHPLSFPSPAFNISLHQGLFWWVHSGSQSIRASASVLPMNIQDRSPLGWTGWISLQSKGLSRVFCNTTVQRHQFFISRYENDTPLMAESKE